MQVTPQSIEVAVACRNARLDRFAERAIQSRVLQHPDRLEQYLQIATLLQRVGCSFEDMLPEILDRMPTRERLLDVLSSVLSPGEIIPKQVQGDAIDHIKRVRQLLREQLLG